LLDVRILKKSEEKYMLMINGADAAMWPVQFFATYTKTLIFIRCAQANKALLHYPAPMLKTYRM